MGERPGDCLHFPLENFTVLLYWTGADSKVMFYPDVLHFCQNALACFGPYCGT